MIEGLELSDEVWIAQIRWDALDDVAGFNIQDAPCPRARSASRFLRDESYRIRLKLQPVLPLGSIGQLGIGKETSLSQNLVIVTHERPSIAKRQFTFLQTLHKPSYGRGPLFPETPDSVHCRWLRKLANQTIRHESAPTGSFAEGYEGSDSIMEREDELVKGSVEEIHCSLKISPPRREGFLPVNSNYGS